MRPQRQVRRSSTRPMYGRRRANVVKRSKPSLPAFRIRASVLKLMAITAVILGILVAFAQLTKLEKISITGVQDLDKEHLQRVAEEGARKQWFGRNTMLLSTGALSDYMIEAEPGLKEVKIERQGFNSINLIIAERQPSLNWKAGGVIYLLDIDGTVIGESKGPYVKLPTVTDSTNLPVESGKRVAPSSFVSFCAEMYKRLPEAGVKPVDMIVPETTTEVNFKTDKGYLIKMDTTRTVEGELNDLKAVQSELAKAKKVPTEYIDLRIENKAYYK